MRYALSLLLILAVTTGVLPLRTASASSAFMLGNEVLFARHRNLIEGRRIGLITSFSGVNSRGESLVKLIADDDRLNLTALFGPEHGVDGTYPAGVKVNSYTHPVYNIPVHSLYGDVRKPTPAMLKGIDVLLFDIQDVGARYYTYISTMNYCMIAAQEAGIPFIVLDRPNPLGGMIVEGPVLEPYYASFVGVDVLPMAHGMTIGELARYFNRKIGADLTVIPMTGYTREMLFQDTGLAWVQTSPNIPGLINCFAYMSTGLGEGTGVVQDDKFQWVGGAGLNPERFAAAMNSHGLPGVRFLPEQRGSRGGARLEITDFRSFNPALTGMHVLFTARQQWKFTVPRSGTTPASIVMFDKIMGSNRVGQWLLADYTPAQAVAAYQAELAAFRAERERYLLYGYAPGRGTASIVIDGHIVYTDVAPVIRDGRTLVPIRVIAENFGASVDWQERDSTVTIIRGATSIRMQLGSKTVHVNGVAYDIPYGVAPFAQSGRTLVPLRFISEYLGASVDWDESIHAVMISR